MMISPVWASDLDDLVEQCSAAVGLGDHLAIVAVADEVQKLRYVFNTAAQKALEECLSDGLGEPWIYDAQAGRFMSSADATARDKAEDEAKAAENLRALTAAQDAAERLAKREENLARVVALVYASCESLYRQDTVAAMTNDLCVQAFIDGGLPAD